jgi:steroid 5-alpha reductase family enzyme
MALIANLLLILSAMTLLWIVSLRRRDASIVDPFWGLGFVILATSSVWQSSAAIDSRSWLLLAMVTVWGLRLSLHLLWRNWGHGEDSRYAAMRQRHAAKFWWVSLLTVFGLQAALLWLIALPIQWALLFPQPTALNSLDRIGFLLWLVGFSFESIGDWQLARFKADPAHRGQVFDQGLWRYTRHPNYFGDFCVWWGIFCVAVSAAGVWTIFSPLLMSYLLIRVSGVQLLESTIADRRPGYLEYKRRTNAFFPGPPRNRPAEPLP